MNTTILIDTLLNGMSGADTSVAYRHVREMFVYNIGKFSGSPATTDTVASLLETGELPIYDGAISRHVIEEIEGLSDAFDYILRTTSKPLSEDFIKHLHRRLKKGVSLEIQQGLIPGEYRSGAAVLSKMQALLENYKPDYNNFMKEICTFLVEFINISPFPSDNDAIALMLLFRECLHTHIATPFIVRAVNVDQYNQALRVARETGDYSKLMEYFAEEQEYFNTEINPLLPPLKFPLWKCFLESCKYIIGGLVCANIVGAIAALWNKWIN